MRPTVSSEVMKNRTKQLALIVIRLCRTLPQSLEARIIARQLLRSATSVAANYRSVCRARSTADFTSKLGLVLEEADETPFWLELLVDAGIARREQINLPLDEANQLVSIFVASVRTVKSLKSEI
jgi:four helix bundle protein